jgi:MEDS: MEthanogen/methylotroph, DcmR Sensory domain
MSGSNNPMNFVHQLETGEHVVLFHEDHRYAERIEFEFLQDGLDKAESCAITTYGSIGSLENRMAAAGIDVAKHQQDGSLHLFKLEDPMFNPKGIERGIAEIYESLISSVEEPFRIVSTTLRDLSDPEEYFREIRLERRAQKTFDGHDEKTMSTVFRDKRGIIMCPYPVSGFGPDNKKWLNALTANHHAAIFAPKRLEGFAMRLRTVRETAGMMDVH